MPELLLQRQLARQPMSGHEPQLAITPGTEGVRTFGLGCHRPVPHLLKSDGVLVAPVPNAAAVGLARVVVRLAKRRQTVLAARRWTLPVSGPASVASG